MSERLKGKLGCHRGGMQPLIFLLMLTMRCFVIGCICFPALLAYSQSDEPPQSSTPQRAGLLASSSPRRGPSPPLTSSDWLRGPSRGCTGWIGRWFTTAPASTHTAPGSPPAPAPHLPSGFTANRESFVGRSTNPGPVFRINSRPVVFMSVSADVAKRVSHLFETSLAREWASKRLRRQSFRGGESFVRPLASERHRLGAYDHYDRSMQRAKGSSGHVVSCFARDLTAVLAAQQTGSNGSFPEKTRTSRADQEAAREGGFFADGQNPVPCSSIVSAHQSLKHTSNASTVLFLAIRVF
jgi:hypothetical protein